MSQSQVHLDEAAIQAAVIQQLVERYARDPSLRRDVIEKIAGYGQPLQITEKEIARRLEASGVGHVTNAAYVKQIVDRTVSMRVEAYLTNEQLSTIVGIAVTRILGDAYGKRVKAAARKMVEAAMTALVNDTDG